MLYHFKPTQLLHDQNKITTSRLWAATCPIQYIVKGKPYINTSTDLKITFMRTSNDDLNQRAYHLGFSKIFPKLIRPFFQDRQPISLQFSFSKVALKRFFLFPHCVTSCSAKDFSTSFRTLSILLLLIFSFFFRWFIYGLFVSVVVKWACWKTVENSCSEWLQFKVDKVFFIDFILARPALTHDRQTSSKVVRHTAVGAIRLEMYITICPVLAPQTTFVNNFIRWTAKQRV